jgi:hypothetical protein
MISRTLPMKGTLSAKVTRAPGPGLAWKLQNNLRPVFWMGWLFVMLAHAFSRLTGIITLTSQLSIRLRKASGGWINYGVVSRRVITDTGVALLVDDWQAGTPRINGMNYHGCGTGVGAEAAANTALGTESTTILVPDSTRATGTITQPTAPVVQTVGVVTFDGAGAITEHGILNQAATGGGVLWDRSLFAAINVASGDTITFTYQCTITAGT